MNRDQEPQTSSVHDMQIFWTEPEGTIDVYGIYLFGLFDTVIPPTIQDEIASVWENLMSDSEITDWNYPEGPVCDIAIRLDRELDDPLDSKTWLERIAASLDVYVRAGAIVAWCGFEDSSPCPEIFDPDVMAGNAFAAASRNLGFLCDTVPEDVMRPLSNPQMDQVWLEIRRHLDSR